MRIFRANSEQVKTQTSDVEHFPSQLSELLVDLWVQLNEHQTARFSTLNKFKERDKIIYYTRQQRMRES